MKRSCRGVPKLVEQFIDALANGEAGFGFLSFHIRYTVFQGYTNQSRHQILKKSIAMSVQATMRRLRDLIAALMDMPHYLVPFHGCS